MPVKHLPAKDGITRIDSGDLQAFLEANGVTVGDGGVTGNTDGSVLVDTLATTSLDAAWDAYEPPAPPPPPVEMLQIMAEAIGAATTLDELKAALIEIAGPALVLREA